MGFIIYVKVRQNIEDTNVVIIVQKKVSFNIPGCKFRN
jgi:hypothetical protein